MLCHLVNCVKRVHDISPHPRRLASSVVDVSSMETFKYMLFIKLRSYIQSVLFCNHDSDLLCWHYFSQVCTNIGRFMAVLSHFKPAEYSCVCQKSSTSLIGVIFVLYRYLMM